MHIYFMLCKFLTFVKFLKKQNVQCSNVETWEYRGANISLLHVYYVDVDNNPGEELPQVNVTYICLHTAH